MNVIEMDRTQGVDADFRDFFDAQVGRVVRFAALLGAQDPEDVAQEAFCRLFERRAQLSEVARDPVAYLNRTVVNIVRDRHRRKLVSLRAIRLQRREIERHIDSAEDVAVRGTEARRVFAALDHLPARRREAVVLRFWLDLPYAEIADLMGTSVGAAKSAVSRGIDDLHQHLRADLDRELEDS